MIANLFQLRTCPHKTLKNKYGLFIVCILTIRADKVLAGLADVAGYFVGKATKNK